MNRDMTASTPNANLQPSARHSRRSHRKNPTENVNTSCERSLNPYIRAAALPLIASSAYASASADAATATRACVVGQASVAASSCLRRSSFPYHRARRVSSECAKF